MKGWRRGVWVVLIWMLVLAACAGQGETTATVPPTGAASGNTADEARSTAAVSPTEATPLPLTPAGDAANGAIPSGGEAGPETLADLVAALQAAGAQVQEGNPVDQPFFSISGRILTVNGGEVQAFEFPDALQREQASRRITVEGQPSPTVMIQWLDDPHFWGVGRLIVLYVGRDEAVLDALNGVLGEPITRPLDEVEDDVNKDLPAVRAAVDRLAQLQGVPATDITVVAVEARQWPDACLGAAGAGQSCAQVITPGYLVTLAANGRTFEVRTDQTGGIVRL
jgi:hypothetical protein